ncbi:MAG: dicarboxylate/amino acid:cation symporter [Eisenbergiella massiliensis]
MDEEKKRNLTTIIFIALILGAAAGLALNLWAPQGYVRDEVIVNGIFYVIGQGFIRLMQMLVVPLVFCSLVCGSMAIGDTRRLGKVGMKTIAFYLLTTAIAITVAILLASLINPGTGLDMGRIETTETAVGEKLSMADTLLQIIPTNPLGALASGEMLPIILFALIIGVILAHRGEKADTVSSFFSQFNDIMMDMTMGVMKLAPVGVFCLIARTFAGLGLDAFLPLLKYMLAVFLALALQGLVVYQVLLKLFTGLSPVRFLKKFAPVMAFAFSTATSNATIPLSIDTLHRKMGVSKKISSFTIPLGATINMDGTAIMQGVAVVFAAQAFHIQLSAADFLTVIATATLASIGTAGVPSVGLITLSMVFNSVGLPVEAIGLIMGIDRILDMTRTAVNITGDAVCTTIVARQDNAVNGDFQGRFCHHPSSLAAPREGKAWKKSAGTTPLYDEFYPCV